MPTVVKIVGIKKSGVSPKTQKPWAITQVQLDSGQLADTFDSVAVGDSGEVSFDAQYNTYGFKKDKGSTPMGSTPMGAQPTGTPMPVASPTPKYQPKDEQGIKAMWAIGQAVSVHNTVKVLDAGPDLDMLDMIEGLAGELFLMVDRVKAGSHLSSDYEERPFSDDEAPVEEEVVDDL